MNKVLKVMESTTPQVFRRRAEEAARKDDPHVPEQGLSPEATRQMLHELRVHQIQLEMQNDELLRAHGELNSSRSRYFDLYDLAPVGYVSVSEQGAIQEANLTASTMLGLSRPAMGQHMISQFILNEDQDIFFRHRKELLETCKPQSCDLRMVKPDGTVFWVNLSATAARSEEINTPEIRLVLSDITTRRQREEELRTLRAAVEQSANIIVITSPQGQIEYVNPAFEINTGYTVDEAVGGPSSILKSGEQGVAYYQQLWATITSGKTWRGQFHNRRKNGTLYWEAATISPVLNARGEIAHFIAIKENISDRKTLEAKLAEAVVRADSANQAKSELLANMSHEIRTPMNGVIGMTDLLLDTGLSPEQLEYAQAIRFCSDSLLILINDILDFSKGEAGQIEFESLDFPIRSTIEDAANILAVEAKKKGVAVVCTVAEAIPQFLRGDPARLRQILFNLLSNAIKFTDRGSVTVQVDPITETEASVSLRFQVTDTGIGIPEDKLEHIFSKFSQTDPSITRKFGGTGLGLAICRQLVHLFQGEIEVASKEGEGSTFSFTAVFQKPNAQAAKEDPAPSAPRKPPVRRRLSILVAEDNPINRTLAIKMLENLGHVAVAVSNGQEAIESLCRMPYDMVFLDCQMPVLDGFAATRTIRDPASGVLNPAIPIIALTSYAMSEDRSRCMDAGMNDYVSKPASADDLAAAIERCSTRSTTRADSIERPARAGTSLDFDRKGFFERTGDDREFAAEVADAFLADSPPIFEQLSDAISAGDSASARKFAHTLKGSSANIGGVAFSRIAAQIEAAGAEKNLERMAELLPAASTAMQNLLALLKNEFSPPGTPS